MSASAAGQLIADYFGGHVESFQPQLGEGQLARVLFVISEIDKTRPDPDMRALDLDIAALTRTWEDDYSQALFRSERFDTGAREEAVNRFKGAFTAAYRERYPVSEALIDTAEIMSARDDETIRARVYRRSGDAENIMRCKFYARGDVLALSATVPILENMGLFVDSEVNFELHLKRMRFTPRSAFTCARHRMPLGGRQADRPRARRPAVRTKPSRLSGPAKPKAMASTSSSSRCRVRGAKRPSFARSPAIASKPASIRRKTMQEQALANNTKIAALILALLQGALRSPSAGESRDAHHAVFEARIHDRSQAHRSREPR
jgi:hypothetical protein